MSLSELYRLAKGKVESSHQETTACSVDPSSVSDNDFFELVWENGQILMQGQSSKGRKPSGVNNLFVSAHDLPSHSPRSREKDSGNGMNLKGGKFGSSVLNDFPLSVPSDELGDDEMITWLNYPMDDQLNQDYCSGLLSELSGVAVNELSIHNNFSPESKRTSANEANPSMNSVSLHTGVSSEQENPFKVAMSVGCPTTSGSSLVHPLSSTKSHTSFPSFRSRISDITNCSSNSNQNASSADICHIQGSLSVLPSIRMQKHDQGPSATNAGIMNFSHFSRPVAMVKASLESIGARGNPDPASSDKMPNKDKGSIPTAVEYPCESTLMDSSGALEKDVGSHSQPIMVVANEGSKMSTNEVFEVEHAAEPSDHRCGEHSSMAEKSSNQVPSSAAKKAIADGDKTTEPVVTSSDCSGNSAERASNDPRQNVKRKRCDTEDMEYPSDGIEEDSMGAKKAPPARGGSGSKRSRAAEVHNLSERRRRDRINEKMRALQELIPNCNKVDKASMLDEAIEYLKSLQLQLQIMSMGAGMCVPPMMLPSGMQHMHPAHMPRFSHMGVGMGMGMGYGMSMMNMNGGAPGCSVMQIPHMQGSRFPGPPISGMSDLHGMPVSNLPMFGLHGQGPSMSLPHAPAPLFSFAGATPSRPTIGLNVSGLGGHIGNVDYSQTSSSRQPFNPQMVLSIDVNGLHGQTETKFLETKEVGEKFASVQKNDQVPHVNCRGAVD